MVDLINPVYCPQCKKAIPQDAELCPLCGASVTNIIIQARRREAAKIAGQPREAAEAQHQQPVVRRPPEPINWTQIWQWIKETYFRLFQFRPKCSYQRQIEQKPRFAEYAWRAVHRLLKSGGYAVPALLMSFYLLPEEKNEWKTLYEVLCIIAVWQLLSALGALVWYVHDAAEYGRIKRESEE